MKIKSALICDLLNLIGLPEVDSALQRAQNDRRVNGPNRRNRETSSSNLKASNRGDAENAAKNARRSASVEARRFASAPRLHELENMVKNTRLENERYAYFVASKP